jgi:hypothetical protein
MTTTAPDPASRTRVLMPGLAREMRRSTTVCMTFANVPIDHFFRAAMASPTEE